MPAGIESSHAIVFPYSRCDQPAATFTLLPAGTGEELANRQFPLTTNGRYDRKYPTRNMTVWLTTCPSLSRARTVAL